MKVWTDTHRADVCVIALLDTGCLTIHSEHYIGLWLRFRLQATYTLCRLLDVTESFHTESRSEDDIFKDVIWFSGCPSVSVQDIYLIIFTPQLGEYLHLTTFSQKHSLFTWSMWKLKATAYSVYQVHESHVIKVSTNTLMKSWFYNQSATGLCIICAVSGSPVSQLKVQRGLVRMNGTEGFSNIMRRETFS